MNAIPAQGRRRRRDRHGRADAAAASRTRWCWPPPRWPASTACSRSAARRRSARSPTARRRFRAVDKITGPGNAYVASAKRRVFGTVGIDMIAGPSEILVLADGTTPPDWVAMDLFTQAEHDELAQSILLCPDAAYIDARATPRSTGCCRRMPRRDIIRASLEGRGALIQTRVMEEACAISNRIAPEHLEVSARDPQRWEPLLQPRRRDLPRRLHQREPGRLLRRPEPRAADRAAPRASRRRSASTTSRSAPA